MTPVTPPAPPSPPSPPSPLRPALPLHDDHDLAHIDPFSAIDRGVYRDPFVEVHLADGPPTRRSLHMVRTAHFDLTHEGGRVVLVHRVPADNVDDDLSGLLADELFNPGWLRGPELFERLFTGIVLTHGPDPVGAWARFYRQTLARIQACLDGAGPGPVDASAAGTHGTIPGYAPVYAHTEDLLAGGTVLELGACFGFLSLRLAASGRRVTATDLNVGSVALLRAVAPVLGVGLDTRTGDAARFSAAGGVADNVLLIHLLEHLDAERGRRALAEALRLARRRVVVAVPLEDEADETWGHVRTISLDDLRAWGSGSGLAFEVHEHHGGWLVLDVAS